MNIITADSQKNAEKIPGTERFEDGNEVYDVRSIDGRTLQTRMMELQKVFSNMLDKMKCNDILSKAATICIITFDLFADCYMEFNDIHHLYSNAHNKTIGIIIAFPCILWRHFGKMPPAQNLGSAASVTEV